MTLAYQYDASGYFAGQIDDHGGPLPNNATRSQPDLREGFIPRWDGQAWQQAENHQGKEGYLHGRPHTINQYGPYPAGWSDTHAPAKPGRTGTSSAGQNPGPAGRVRPNPQL